MWVQWVFTSLLVDEGWVFCSVYNCFCVLFFFFFGDRICCRRMSSKPSLASPKFISVERDDIHSRSKSHGVNINLVSYSILAQEVIAFVWCQYHFD
ncbi:hypothetical protein Pint_07261 [Pistacia integerrima]|uniref:Uncharacterized protein n=1 Tax=Pistacia integerrima TaxID=434235 RepID=A0ACC0XTK9_9ROSI|nr:hypothetical protein Pint_07261 [Pistacia integerrima]